MFTDVQIKCVVFGVASYCVIGGYHHIKTQLQLSYRVVNELIVQSISLKTYKMPYVNHESVDESGVCRWMLLKWGRRV
jgi:hypothetical protein